jgi:hypothetical protein
MLELIMLVAFTIFVFGILVGVRCQEINLRRREQRLAEERRFVNNRLSVLCAQQEVNDVWPIR